MNRPRTVTLWIHTTCASQALCSHGECVAPCSAVFHLLEAKKGKVFPPAQTVVLQHAAIKRNHINYCQGSTSPRYWSEKCISLEHPFWVTLFYGLTLIRNPSTPQDNRCPLRQQTAPSQAAIPAVPGDGHEPQLLQATRQDEGGRILLAKTRC